MQRRQLLTLPLALAGLGDVARGVEIPLKAVAEAPGLLTIEVTVNDLPPLVGCIDTGNTSYGMMFHWNAAERLELPENTRQAHSMLGVGREVNQLVHPSAVRSAKLGEFTLGGEPPSAAIAKDLGPNLMPVVNEVEVSLGVPLFRRYTLELDAKGKRIQLHTRGTPAGAGDFDLGAVRNLVLVDVFLNRFGPFYFALDTTAPRSLISPELAAQMQLPSGGEGVTAGTLSFHRFVAGEVSLKLEAVRQTLSARSGAQVDGVIGMDLMKLAWISLDFRNRKIFAQTRA